ncbi:hypothetical protein BU23DRAFT_238666 [Bimuria novae-zelandiae CBS 107.79]|uniref:Uncharacterized protein n=1 Tax=Bimuria novae-zelandiae CBS 107.79 TaxID=1447943 RepID=A0A6A5V8E4_9PLEO|nr:hypothetical protein BU23DRAFT_238666 [Bimuria novae-zelandiae CBS 107.79]
MDAMIPKPKFYGFTSLDSCDVFAFPFGGIPLVIRRDFYQVEHVLEWQTMTDFFSWIGYKKKANELFLDSDPSKSGRVNVCAYWKATWTGEGAKAFPIGQSACKVVEQHLQDEYPSLQHTPHEFVWLEKTLNSPPKANMRAWKNGNERLSVFNRQSMIRNIAGTRRTRRDIDKAKERYLDLKYLLGARRCMRSPAIAAIMKEQVNRMGDILDKIDRELPSDPKDKNNPWVSQSMGALWKEYMEERFRIANSRTEKDMDEYFEELRDTWSKSPTTGLATKHFAQEIRKLHAEWMKEKRIPWKKPW